MELNDFLKKCRQLKLNLTGFVPASRLVKGHQTKKNIEYVAAEFRQMLKDSANICVSRYISFSECRRVLKFIHREYGDQLEHKEMKWETTEFLVGNTMFTIPHNQHLLKAELMLLDDPTSAKPLSKYYLRTTSLAINGNPVAQQDVKFIKMENIWFNKKLKQAYIRMQAGAYKIISFASIEGGVGNVEISKSA